MTDDVEKRWHDPGMYRRAAGYVAAVLVAAALVGVAVTTWAERREPCADAGSVFCDTASRATILAGPGVVLAAGTVGAFVATYRVWKRHRAWPIWQGAGWFLMTVTLAFLAVGAGTVGA
ncbi:hypothetical protein BJY24_006215 [Nocardia transvalensis]|uniref:Uncharacterized protein n=1 Tax=Nocardia transvalensis TaxID=37333 RepID=A0A7W9PKQ5_9NOCA|nr:hypothetical protein [Nocardia transvalensis]MBB5917303.1 hypothetical protein [Nocardia transvalensis]